jgi:thiol:disulfide interchange protein DsbD
VDVDVAIAPTRVKRGETVIVKLSVTPKPGAYTYPAFPKDPTQKSKNTIDVPSPGDLIFIGKVTDPDLAWEMKPRGGDALALDAYTHNRVNWELKAVVSERATPGPKSIVLDSISLLVCDEQNCYPLDGRKLPPVEFIVEEGKSSKTIAADLEQAEAVLKQAQVRTAPLVVVPPERGPGPSTAPPSATAGGATPGVETRKIAKTPEAYAEEMKELEGIVIGVEKPPQPGLWGFVATGAAWGLISLVTPCVFPMIPITVSIFLKQAHGSLRERLKLAGIYCLTIISVLGLSAFALLKFMALLSTHPATNILLGALFIVLALSLFGMFELALPNVIQKRLQARQSRGGVIGTIFGALAFTVISFTCVAPFLGGFAGISAGSDGSGGLVALPTTKEVAGGLAFATAFAAPFFVLALLPGLMKALPRSGGWLDSVKVVMGFLELAAALKFLRTAELRLLPTPQYFTYDVVLSGWVAISGACGLYLLNVFRLPHDEEKPSIGVTRLLLSITFLGLALYLAPALLKGADGKSQRPAGVVYAWVESFLLPQTAPPSGAKEEDLWGTDLKDAVAAARKSGRPIFLDFTGVTCTNCSFNEHDVFPIPGVHEELRQFEKVQLYTDEVPASFYAVEPEGKVRRSEGRANGDFQLAVFKDIKLPTYAVLVPRADGRVKVIGTYTEGKINEPAKFIAFLKEMRELARGGQSQ